MKFKLLALGLVVGLLVLALGQIRAVVHDRQAHREAAVQSVAQSLAGPQTLLGPWIRMSCTEEWDVKAEKEARVERRQLTLDVPPAQLSVKADGQLEARSRGLHATQVMALKAQLSARWTGLPTIERQQPGSRLACAAPVMMLSVSDARGIRQASLSVDGNPLELRSGTLHAGYVRGIHALLAKDTDPAAPVTAQIGLELLGTQRLAIVPLGSANEVRLTSNWAHPSFDGRFLPSDREVNTQGFSALWRVSSLASTAQQDLVQGKPVCSGGAGPDAAESPSMQKPCIEAFGVRFVDPGDTYALSDRATKYGLLFIGLTFLAVGMFEVMKSLRVHPIQYLLVGAALSVFFLLLVSLSEHIAFSAAYASAACACVLLLTYYASHMLGNWRRGGSFGAGIAVLYGLLYVLLQLEQTALVVGAVALFLALGTIMTLTRRVDWYARLRDLKSEPDATAT